MLVCLKTHKGGLNLNIHGLNIKLSGYGLIDNVDDTLYQKAREIYSFLKDWEKDGIIEVNQNEKQDKASFETEVVAQKEQQKANGNKTKAKSKKAE